MRLYTLPFAPNVIRVLILAREKGIVLETVDVSADVAAYRAVNPLGQVPALELEDGRILTESLTVCQYLDALSGSPHLFGEGADERLLIAMWERRAEMTLFHPSVEYGHHVHPMFAPWMTQFPDYAATLIPKAEKAAAVFADQLGRTRYVAGERFTAADITAFLGYFSLVAFGALSAHGAEPLRRWSAELLARDGMEPVRQLAAAFAAQQAAEGHTR